MTTVTITEDNMVKWGFSFDNFEEAESMFLDLITEHNGEPLTGDELEYVMDEGCWEHEVFRTNIQIFDTVRREDFPFEKVVDKFSSRV